MNKIITYMFIFGAFVMINAPSLKLIYSSELINAFGMILLAIGFLYRIIFEKIFLNKKNLLLILCMTIFFLLLLISTLWSPVQFTLVSFLQYVSSYLSFIFLFIGFRTIDVKKYIYLQLFWSIILSGASLLGFIQTNSALGQHYLTIGLPLGLGLVGIFGIIMRDVNERSKSRITSKAFIAAILFLGLITLNGRSPIIMSVLVIYLSWMILIYFEKNKSKNILMILIISMLLIYLTANFAGEELLDRFNRLSSLNTNPNEEPRTLIYNSAFRLIKRNFFGYGLQSFQYYTGYLYPHNIFLEIAFESGLQAIISFVPIVLTMLIKYINFLKNKNFLFISISMMSWYVLLIWNISYSLSNAYVFFSILALQLIILKPDSSKVKSDVNK